jgi:hypothetical protein
VPDFVLGYCAIEADSYHVAVYASYLALGH